MAFMGVIYEHVTNYDGYKPLLTEKRATQLNNIVSIFKSGSTLGYSSLLACRYFVLVLYIIIYIQLSAVSVN